MKETERLDKILCGIEPHDFSGISSSADDRTNGEYSWGDIFMNLNDTPFQKDTAILVTSWSGHLKWLKHTLASYRKTGAYVVLAYDNSTYIWDNIDSEDYIFKHLPRPIHNLLAHSVVLKHKTYDADKRIGWFWNVKYGLSVIKTFPGIKYVYCTNGDCLIERPEGLEEVKTLLGHGDFIAGQSEPRRTIHTACVLYRIEALEKIMEYMTARMRHTIIGGTSPECLLRDAVDTLKLKEIFGQSPRLPDGDIDWYCTINAPSTWKTLLGFRNLYSEQEDRTNNRRELLNPKYLDPYRNWLYFNSDERRMMCKYYETLDRRWLYMWWDQNCNSIEERTYHLLEYYGKEPLLEDGSNWA